MPVAAWAGTDSFADYYRSMAVGTTRLYVKVDGDFHLAAYLESLKEGRSFLSTGPLIDFRVEGAFPGDAIEPEESADFELKLATTVPVERVEVLVNGDVVWSDTGLAEAGERSYRGRIDVPTGGWVAARAHGGIESWPAMNGYPFAHSSPIWLGAKGSIDPGAAQRAASDLLNALNVAETRLRAGYEGVPIPRLEERFAAARAKLTALGATSSGSR